LEEAILFAISSKSEYYIFPVLVITIALNPFLNIFCFLMR